MIPLTVQMVTGVLRRQAHQRRCPAHLPQCQHGLPQARRSGRCSSRSLARSLMGTTL